MGPIKNIQMPIRRANRSLSKLDCFQLFIYFMDPTLVRQFQSTKIIL